MADKSTKIKIASWCLMVALCVFSGALCLYFFVFNRTPNERGGSIYTDLNELLYSENQTNVDASLGDAATLTNARQYAQNYASKDYKSRFLSTFLCYRVDHEIVDTYKFVISFLGNADYKYSVKIDNAVKDYTKALEGVQGYLDKFNEAYSVNPSSEATQKNFGYMLDDFEALEAANHTLAMGIIGYAGQIYYGYDDELNGYVSEKYALTYALSCQSMAAYRNRTLLLDENGLTRVTYNETETQLASYKTVKANQFQKELTDDKIFKFVTVMVDSSKSVEAFLKSENKKSYYQNADATLKPKLRIVAEGIGVWEGGWQ